MSYYLVQQWWVLPNIAEPLQAGDTSGQSGQPQFSRAGSSYSLGRFANPAHLQQGSSTFATSPNTLAFTHRPYQGQSSWPIHNMGDPQHSFSAGQARLSSSPLDPSSEQSEGVFSMGTMSTALSNFPTSPGYGTPHSTHRMPGTMSNISQQYQQVPQLAGQVGATNISSQYIAPFNSGQSMPAQGYGPQHVSSHRGPPSPMQQQFQHSSLFSSQHPQAQSYMYYSAPFGQISPSQQHFQGPQRLQENILSGMGRGIPQNMGVATPTPLRFGGTQQFQGPVSSDILGTGIGGPRSIPSAPRGPPRKPKQSGHALWVGNLPPGALVNDLKDHFSRDATNDIESVFLISKSNCAFVNYKTEESCAAAMSRFHDSRFQGVRLVCRLRRTPAAATPGVPTGPAALSSSAATSQTQTGLEAVAQNRAESSRAEEATRHLEGAEKINDKYFVVKSLTIEDLELSARNGIWATQSHNEEALNKAYESVENVYLIFSANKSGEYFGYARMASPINEESAANLDWTPRTEAIIDDPDLPRSIPTPATETAPKGRIIDDSARGTIFWEAESEEDSEPPTPLLPPEETGMVESGDEQTPLSPGGVQAFGRPFKIEWITTNRLPFYRTRGLRNPWNSNREVKIARDGTELETSVGRRLVQMFHRPAVPSQMPQSPTSPGMQMGYPSIRPF